jgi:hypothetical protein
MRALGFDNYEGVLKVYLAKFREVSHVVSVSVLSLPRASHAILTPMLYPVVPVTVFSGLSVLLFEPLEERLLILGPNSPGEAKTVGGRRRGWKEGSRR